MTRTFNSGNQETTGGASQFVYDGNGNPITYKGRKHSYDIENHLTEVRDANDALLLKAGYRADGMRAWKENSAGTRTYFVYDGDWLLAELDGAGQKKALNIWGVTGLIVREVK